MHARAFVSGYRQRGWHHAEIDNFDYICRKAQLIIITLPRQR